MRQDVTNRPNGLSKQKSNVYLEKKYDRLQNPKILNRMGKVINHILFCLKNL